MSAYEAASIHILFLVPRLDKASTRYRVNQYLPALSEAGFSWEIREMSRSARDWPRLWRQVKCADIVFIQKKLFSPLEIRLLRKLCRHLVYDLDDAVMFKDGPASVAQLARQKRRFLATVRRADLVIAGNSYLSELTGAEGGEVIEIPTSLDLGLYPPRPAHDLSRDEIVLGWIGSRGTLKYLQEIAPALEKLGQNIPGFRLKIVADDFFDLRHMPVEKKRWSAADEIADLHSFDIGLMPLSDDPWSRGKCGFKLLQYMAVGIPVVCSPVGANCDIVTDGVEGYWARSQQEWVDILSHLGQDPDLRGRMGAKGRAAVERNYSLTTNAPRLIACLRNVANGGDSFAQSEVLS